mgnify:CR=1 FL=1
MPGRNNPVVALQQLAATLGSRLLQQSARSQGFSQLSISLLPGQQHLQLARGCALSQQRALVTIDVVNNQVDRALKTLKRKVVEEGLPKQWKAHEVGGRRVLPLLQLRRKSGCGRTCFAPL